jgi:hypothetical protein
VLRRPVETAAYSDDDGEEVAYGIAIGSLVGTLENTGRIVATSDTPDQAIAIRVGSGSGDVVLHTGGHLQGQLEIDSGVDVEVVSGPGTSIYWTFENLPTGGFELTDAGGLPLFVSGNSVLSYDASALAASANVLADVTSIGGGAFQANLALAAGGADIGVAQGILGGGGLSYFFSGDVARMDYDGNGTTSQDQSVDSHGISVGATGQMDNGLTFGVIAGVANADVSVSGPFADSFRNDVSGGFIGGSVATNYGGYIIDAGLRFGRLGHDDSRTINSNLAPGGTGVATASYNSTYFSPEIGVSRTMYVGDLMVTPSARYRYTRQSIEGYTEAGTMVNATVGARKVTVGQLDLGVDVCKQVGAGVLTGSFGVMSRNVGGDDTVTVTIAGDTNTIGVFGDSQQAATIGVSYSQDLSNGVSFNIGADAVVGGGDISGYSLGASLIAKF